jgi:hypothetical protein
LIASDGLFWSSIFGSCSQEAHDEYEVLMRSFESGAVTGVSESELKLLTHVEMKLAKAQQAQLAAKPHTSEYATDRDRS